MNNGASSRRTRIICIIDDGASSRRTRIYRFRARRYDFPEFISAVNSMTARFQSCEYILSEIFMTCGTQLNT